MKDCLVRDGLDPQAVDAPLHGEAILRCRTLDEITAHMDALGESLFRLVGEQGDARNRRLIAQAARYIDEHLDQQMTLQLASDHVGLNASYFSHLFQEVCGQSFSQYVTGKRIERAKRMILADPGAKIYEVAYSCGFSSVEHFSRTFKRETGASPAQYKFMPTEQKR